MVSRRRHLVEMGVFSRIIDSEGDDAGYYVNSRKIAIDISNANGVIEIVDDLGETVLTKPLADEIVDQTRSTLLALREEMLQPRPSGD